MDKILAIICMNVALDQIYLLLMSLDLQNLKHTETVIKKLRNLSLSLINAQQSFNIRVEIQFHFSL